MKNSKVADYKFQWKTIKREVHHRNLTRPAKSICSFTEFHEVQRSEFQEIWKDLTAEASVRRKWCILNKEVHYNMFIIRPLRKTVFNFPMILLGF
jgi:hypothetical protein